MSPQSPPNAVEVYREITQCLEQVAFLESERHALIAEAKQRDVRPDADALRLLAERIRGWRDRAQALRALATLRGLPVEEPGRSA